MAFNVNNFRNALPKGGARPSLFKVVIPLPPSIGGGSMERISLNTQAASIPSGTIEPVEVFYFGRPFKLPGGRTFEDWTTTVINDEDFAVRHVVEEWMDAINGNVNNQETGGGDLGTGGNTGLEFFGANLGFSAGADYAVDAEVIQYSTNGEALRRYRMIGAWPTAIAEITLDWAEASAIETFDITWAFNWWESPAILGSTSTPLEVTVSI